MSPKKMDKKQVKVHGLLSPRKRILSARFPPNKGRLWAGSRKAGNGTRKVAEEFDFDLTVGG